MKKYEREEIEGIKNYIKESILNWRDLHWLGTLIFEEVKYNGMYFLKIKNKYLYIYNRYLMFLFDATHKPKDLKIEQLLNCYSVDDRVTKNVHNFEPDWFLNILAKNDKVVKYLYEQI